MLDETLETEVQKEIDSILEDGILNDMSMAEENMEDISEPEGSSESDFSAEVQEETEEELTDISEPEEETQEDGLQENFYFGEVDDQEENETMNMSQEEDNMSDF